MAITQKLKELLGDLPILEYVGTSEGKPVYRISRLSKYELSISCNGGPSLLMVDVDNIENLICHPWTDTSLRITPDPDLKKDKQ